MLEICDGETIRRAKYIEYPDATELPNTEASVFLLFCILSTQLKQNLLAETILFESTKHQLNRRSRLDGSIPGDDLSHGRTRRFVSASRTGRFFT